MAENDAITHSNGHAHPDPEFATEKDYSPPRGKPFPIVGIGASAGGLEAFGQLLAALPEKTGMAFVLVQHLDPHHESLLAEILAPMSRMPVETVHDGIQVKPDHVYIIPPNTSMELQDGHLRLVAREAGLHLPIDIFFRSLAEVQGSRAIGVVLSGNASDGSRGLRAIKAECGLTFAQDEQSAKFGGMPRNAVETGVVDYVLPPAQIGRQLARLGRHPFLVPAQPGVPESETLPEGDGELKRILAMLQVSTKVDFSQYKTTTVQRRVGRRMMVLQIEKLADYARYLQQKPAEIAELYKDLLISVTSFFRDPDAFEALVGHLAPALQGRARGEERLRIWVPGCATGEEVYSLAIRLYELIEEQNLSLTLQIFGTDISDQALDRARAALYYEPLTETISEARLRRFFVKTDGAYQINKMIRECCIFARHDVTRDAPFSRLDIISCRNLLIYLEPKAQRKVLPTFHYALNPAGVLMLGSAESTAAASDLFTVVDKARHIFGRKAVPTRLVLELAAGPPPGEFLGPPRVPEPAAKGFQKRLERVIQNKYSPDGIVVTGDLQILQFRGRTAPYLDPGPGDATFNLLRMVKEELVIAIRRAVQKAAESDMEVRDEGASLEMNGRIEQVRLEVTPIPAGDGLERYFLIVFSGSGDGALSREPASEGRQGRSSEILEKELAETREYLRQRREEYEAHAEELRAANEETRSANEELQSANEELGTTKEELQSANEELTTVNEELKHRNQELAAINGDLKNFLSAVTAAVIMVDPELRLRRFNLSAEKLFQLDAIDVGRPIGHLRRGQIETHTLEDQVKRVIDTLHVHSEEVQGLNGRWYTVSVRPYRTVDERIAGAVIAFHDIDALKRALEASEEARDYAESLIETVREPLVVLDGDLRVQRATAAFYETFLVTREETEGRFLHDLGNGQWNRQRLRELLGSALFKNEAFHDFEVEHDFPHIGRRTVRLNGRRILRRDPQTRTLLLAIQDVTERREIAEVRFQRLFETAKDGMVVIEAETEAVLDVNPFLLWLTGFSREDFVGKSIADAGALLHLEHAADVMKEVQQSDMVRYDDVQITTRSGDAVSVEVVANRYTVGSQPVVQLNVRDISARKKAAVALSESEERFRLVVESVRDYAIFQVDQEGRIITWNAGAQHLLGWEAHEVLGKHFALIFTPEDIKRAHPERELDKARSEGRAEDERWHVRKDQTRFFASGVLSRSPDGTGPETTFTKVMQDVTARKENDDQLRRSLEEKSMLVREIHHRVKNNLQMIVSLLGLQSSHTEDPRVSTAFEETESRVRAVAHIHEQLYASDDLTIVEVGSYLASLSRELIALHARKADAIRLHIDVGELQMHIERAVPVGLIANELILNSLKHGVRSGGDLRLSLTAQQDGAQATLVVEDSGPGLPAGLDLSKPTTMGYQLIHLLVRQLRARLDVGPGPGTRITVSFPISSTREGEPNGNPHPDR